MKAHLHDRREDGVAIRGFEELAAGAGVFEDVSSRKRASILAPSRFDAAELLHACIGP
jgi:hypothetical protein